MPNSVTNRKIFFLAVNTGYVTGAEPDDRCQDFYVARSGHGLYCAIVGNVVVPGGFGSNNVCAVMSRSERWRRLASGIAQQGARPGIQLTSAWPGYQGIRQFVGRRDNWSQAYRSVVARMSAGDVCEAIDNLRRGAELALDAGFLHIQIHAAHGYLFSLLIDESFSRYCEVVLESLRAWASELNAMNIETSLRFSLRTGDQALDGATRGRLIERLFALPFSFFDVSSGFYNVNKHLIYPSSNSMLATRRSETMALAKRFADKAIIMSGKSQGAWETSLPPNVHIGICRDLIANPHFLRDRAHGCTNCMRCHYFSRGTRDLACELWEGGGADPVAKGATGGLADWHSGKGESESAIRRSVWR